MQSKKVLFHTQWENIQLKPNGEEFYANLADVDAGIVRAQSDDIQRNQAKVEGVVQTRAGHQLNAIAVPLDAQVGVSPRLNLS